MWVIFVTRTILILEVPSLSSPTTSEGICMPRQPSARYPADPFPRMKKPRTRAEGGFACGALDSVPYSEATYLPVT